MRIVEWSEVKRVLKNKIKYSTELCTAVGTPERERLIAAVEIQVCEQILNLQGDKEAGIDE